VLDQIKKRVSELLEQNRISGFVGLIKEGGQIRPYLFTHVEELERLSLGHADSPVGDEGNEFHGFRRYPLNQVLIRLAKAFPEKTFSIFIRGCDERGLNEIFKWNQLKPDKVIPIGVSCPRELAEYCECAKPYPDALVAGDPVKGFRNKSVERVRQLPLTERFQYWRAAFDRCIKCYGCRDVCPMCFCNECSLEDEQLMHKPDLPPGNPIFHLTRAVHMAGRCIDCGLCSETCPAHIPLRILYKEVEEIIGEQFGYKTGYSQEDRSPLNLLGPSPEGTE